MKKKCKCNLSINGIHRNKCFKFPREIDQEKFAKEYAKAIKYSTIHVDFKGNKVKIDMTRLPRGD